MLTLRFLFSSLLLACLLSGIAQSQIIERREEDALILNVALKQTILGEVVGYSGAQPGSILIPVGQVAGLLSLPLNADVANGTISGWYISPNRTLEVNIITGKAIIEGREKGFNPSLAEAHKDDLYIDAALLSTWLPINFAVNMGEMILLIGPHEGEELPIQKQMRMEAQAKERTRLGTEDRHFPILPSPYRLFSFPMVDERITLTSQSNKVNLQSTALITSDLAFQSFSTYLSTNERGIQDARLTLGRQDVERKFLTSYGIGSILFPATDSIGLAVAGNGLTFSNAPINYQTQEKHTFNGNLLPGWFLEIYQNESLISFVAGKADGLFQIEVVLQTGENLVRLVWFSPQGETRQEVYRLTSGTLTPANQLLYRVSGIGGEYQRAGAEVSYGINKTLSINSSATTLTLQGNRYNYGSFNLRGYWQGLYLRGDAISSNTGNLYGGSLQAKLGKLGITVSHYQLNNYISEVYPLVLGEYIRNRTALRLDLPIPRLNVSLWGQKDTLGNGQTLLQGSGRIGFGFRGINASNTFTYIDGSAQTPFMIGDLLVSKFVKGYNVRGEVQYSIKPIFTTQSITATAERAFASKYVGSVGISRTMLDKMNHLLASIMTIKKGHISYGVSIDYAGRNTTAALTLGISLMRNPISNKIVMSSVPLAGSGALAVRSLGADGLPIEGVGFSGRQEQTGKDGIALITNLPSGQPSNIEVNMATLQNTDDYGAWEGKTLYGRPGRIVEVDLPILTLSEISGTVWSADKKPAPGTEIILISDGKEIAKVRAGFDSWYYFSAVKPGVYLLRLKGLEDISIIVGNDGTPIDHDITLPQ